MYMTVTAYTMRRSAPRPAVAAATRKKIRARMTPKMSDRATRHDPTWCELSTAVRLRPRKKCFRSDRRQHRNDPSRSLKHDDETRRATHENEKGTSP